MNTKLYKKVHTQAIEMLKAADSDNDEAFTRLYEELKTLCYENEGDDSKNHPVQWETLADFTEDEAEALLIYKKALTYAEAIQADDYIASICYAMALLLKGEGVKEGEVLNDEKPFGDDDSSNQALSMAKLAYKHSATIEDEELQREIKALLKTFKE